MALLTHSPHFHPSPAPSTPGEPLKPLGFLRRRIDHITVSHARLAHLICRAIPSNCPFERVITLGNYTLHIPALCHLNPVYDELMALRFRALTYLAEVRGEDISGYISR